MRRSSFVLLGFIGRRDRCHFRMGWLPIQAIWQRLRLRQPINRMPGRAEGGLAPAASNAFAIRGARCW